jgi:hypothetical protein
MKSRIVLFLNSVLVLVILHIHSGCTPSGYLLESLEFKQLANLNATEIEDVGTLIINVQTWEQFAFSAAQLDLEIAGVKFLILEPEQFRIYGLCIKDQNGSLHFLYHRQRKIRTNENYIGTARVRSIKELESMLGTESTNNLIENALDLLNAFNYVVVDTNNVILPNQYFRVWNSGSVNYVLILPNSKVAVSGNGQYFEFIDSTLQFSNEEYVN